ncbi:MAG: DUF4157 domain-containing protein [Alphaproteobacteria bacterium]|nr:DUF4157 domain-containing protein [Alphaproteobacteria bacterium]
MKKRSRLQDRDGQVPGEATPEGGLGLPDMLGNGAMQQLLRGSQDGAPPNDSGGPLGPLQEQIEAFFGTDFSQVSIAQDGRPEDIGAQALTQGESLSFAAGRFDPSSPQGMALLGHELAHVVQQRQGRVDTAQAKGGDIVADGSLESEADAAGAALARGGEAPSSLRGGPASGGGGGTQAKSEDSPIQLFGSAEHKSLGDNVEGGGYTMGDQQGPPEAAEYNSRFVLTHGDIIMLSGDFFSPRDTRVNAEGQEEPDPDSLFRISAVPSGSPGQQVGSRDEVVYAIKKATPDDPRFDQVCSEDPERGKWGLVQFSSAVIAAVDARYLNRAASNDEHFVAPNGTDAGPLAGDGASAGGSYRALHEFALATAFDLGAGGSDAGMGLAREAAAQHFLTDHFAAGHLRTPRGSIRTHWQGIYPLFWNNIRAKIALDVATWINDNDNIGYLATVDQIFTDTHATVLAETEDIPPMGFDDLVSLISHDYDNENGLWVTNDLNIQWKLFGDGNLDSTDPANRTREMAELAVRLGDDDVRVAHSLGQQMGEGGLSQDELHAQVRARSASPANPGGERYAPEQVLPRPDPAREEDNGRQNWEQDSVEDLWTTPVTSSTEETFGDAISAAMQGGELNHELSDMASKFPESQTVKSIFEVHPRRGFNEGFLNPLVANPRQGLLDIIHFSPSRGQATQNEDDAVMRELAGEDGEGGMSDEEMQGLTLQQRAERVRQLIGGWTGEDEGEQVIRLFSTASAGQRPVLYEMVEGHRWEGSFRHGVFTTDDDIWDALYTSQLNRLKDIINGG